MVRHCAVNQCNETDTTLLSHRFPKSIEIAQSWQKALKLQQQITELQKKFVVCTRHFSAASYRNVISNSLNTTAIPNLGENSDNERIFTTNPVLRKELEAPTRCHKSLGTSTLKLTYPKQNIQQQVLKRAKLDLEATEVETPRVVIQQYDAEETFEICEYTEEESLSDPIAEGIEDVPPGESSGEYILSDEHTEDDEKPKISIHQEVQTEPIPIESKPAVQSEDSKDEKLISILYPEYQGLTKIQLIELVAEKNRKIESLEDKVQKMEQAMRDLL